MNWSEILKEIILGVIGILISGLGVYVTYLINKHIKNEELKRIINSLNELAQNAVLETYQIYVEALKGSNSFDYKAQKTAFERTLKTIKANMPADVKTWLEANYKDVDRYLRTLIEAQIGLLKSKAK